MRTVVCVCVYVCVAGVGGVLLPAAAGALSRAGSVADKVSSASTAGTGPAAGSGAGAEALASGEEAGKGTGDSAGAAVGGGGVGVAAVGSKAFFQAVDAAVNEEMQRAAAEARAARRRARVRVPFFFPLSRAASLALLVFFFCPAARRSFPCL